MHRARTSFDVTSCATGSVTIKLNGDIWNAFSNPPATIGQVTLDSSVVISDTTVGQNTSASGPFATYTWNVTPGNHTLEWISGTAKDTVDWTWLNVDIDYNATCPPVATNDSVSTTSGSSINVNVLGNDSDPDGDTLTITQVDGQAISSGDTITLSNGSGTVTLNPDGTLTFNPAPGYTGTADFTYTISDGIATSQGSVSTTVTASELMCPMPFDTVVMTPQSDCDGDGITNQAEGYDPDGDEDPNTGTPPVDTDGDGITDYLDLDSDNDGIVDIIEKGTNPDSSTNPIDTDGDGTPDFRDLDADGDGILDVIESGINNPGQLDKNGDGMIDGGVNEYGIATAAVDPNDPTKTTIQTLSDVDGDGKPDYIDLDTDNDTIPDKTEGTKDANNNGIPAFRDPNEPGGKGGLASTGSNLSLIGYISLGGVVMALATLGLRRKLL
jgi:hypothetical protein